MNRVQVTYGGRDYMIADRGLGEVEAEIRAGVESGEARWLDVTWGAGTPLPCRLLLAPGVPIAVLEFPKPAL